MHTLRQDLEALTMLNTYRNRAISLRDRGFAWLNSIKSIKPPESLKQNASLSPKQNENPKQNEIRKPTVIIARVSLPQNEEKKWLGMGNKIEAALLMKVQRNQHMTRSENDAKDSDQTLAEKIEAIDIDSFLPAEVEASEPEVSFEKLDRRIPVLVAANAMQVLTRRAKTALSAQTLCCYYTILHELSLAMRPDWMIGAARAGDGGNVSSFVTGECMRAILALEQVHRRTADFLSDTRELNNKYLTLHRVIEGVSSKSDVRREDDPPGPNHPLQLWADKAIERMWLDWFVSVHPSRGEICFEIPIPDWIPTLRNVRQYLKELPGHIRKGIDDVATQTIRAQAVILEYLGKERPHQAGGPPETQSARAHRYAREHVERIIDDAKKQAQNLSETVQQFATEPDNDDHLKLLEALKKQFTAIADSIHRVLDPSTRYVEGALGRAIANSDVQLDPGELAFAACSYGAATNWQSSSRQYLRRACGTLLKAVPDNGMLATHRPFHSTPRGYKLFPTSCEIVRTLAVLIERTEYDLDNVEILAIGRLLDAIDHMKLDLYNDRIDKDTWYGWNFDGATEQHKPSVWVSCVTVLSLDRLVRMLDSRINAMVLGHFEVIEPRKPHSKVGLNDLIYSDYGFAIGCPSFDGGAVPSTRTPIAIRLEEMRAHLMRVPLPEAPLRSTPFSAVLYGPPQTGKTTLAEALALSSGAPLVRISSFDLTQDPEESIESRGRVIFDALSMLTKAVILFDEFESVLPDRDEKHERSLEFLLTGILPKLVKLHNLARSQALVYFLATNHVERIDSAAIRRGRFDLQMPVYNPDPLSRAAACLYRLLYFRNLAKDWPGAREKDGTYGKEWVDEDWRLNAHAVIRLLNIIGGTIGVPPNELAATFFPLLPKGKSLDLRKPGWQASVPYFAYILEGYKAADVPPLPPEVKEEIAPVGASVWVREEVWLKGFEHSFQQRLREEMEGLAGKIDDAYAQEISPDAILEACLRPPSPITH